MTNLPVLGEVWLQVLVFGHEELCDLRALSHSLVTSQQLVAVALQELHALDGSLGSLLLEAASPGLYWKHERKWLILFVFEQKNSICKAFVLLIAKCHFHGLF